MLVGQLKRLQGTVIDDVLSGRPPQTLEFTTVPFSAHSEGDKTAKPSDSAEPLKQMDEHAPVREDGIHTGCDELHDRPVSQGWVNGGRLGQSVNKTAVPIDVTQLTSRYCVPLPHTAEHGPHAEVVTIGGMAGAGVLVGVAVGEGVGVAVGVRELVLVGDVVGVFVDVTVALLVVVAVTELDIVTDTDADGETVGVTVTVDESDGVDVSVTDGVGVTVGVGLAQIGSVEGDGDGDINAASEKGHSDGHTITAGTHDSTDTHIVWRWTGSGCWCYPRDTVCSVLVWLMMVVVLDLTQSRTGNTHRNHSFAR